MEPPATFDRPPRWSTTFGEIRQNVMNHESYLTQNWPILTQMSWVRLGNLEFELSQSWVNQQNVSGESNQSWVTYVITWVRVESTRKVWVEHNPGRNIPIQGVGSTCHPVFVSVSNGFRPKEVIFNFLPSTYSAWRDRKIGLTLGHRYQNSGMSTLYVNTVTNINHWKFRGDWSLSVAMTTSIQNFPEVRSPDVTWWPDLV